MATIKPFAAVRPKPELASKICELPYDVMSSAEARKLAIGNAISFLHISKPEIDFPPDADPCAPEVYARGRRNFHYFKSQGFLVTDPKPNFYLYRQVMGGHSQIGVVAVADCVEYLNGIIKKHELTRPDKEDDRVRHIEALHSQTGPVFLTYRAVPELDELIARLAEGAPSVDFAAADGVQHTAWVVAEEADQTAIENAFANVPSLYIADGHHRSAAAARVFQARHQTSRSRNFLSVIVPHNQTQILPYNRVLKDLNGHSPEALLEKLAHVFAISSPGAAKPAAKHALGFYFQRQWRALTFLPHLTASADPIERLDVTLLQKQVLAPLFNIEDPRTSARINFVGGIRGTGELEKLVNSGEYACAFSMFPTSIEDLMSIADAGGIMPPKSTWFEPKLRDAMFCHMI